MKKLLLLIALTIVSPLAEAQLRVPPGCFVTDEERATYITPPTCFNESREFVVPYSPGNNFSNEELYAFYGYQYGSEVIFAWDVFTDLKSCETTSAQNKAAADTHYGWYTAEFNKGKQLSAQVATLTANVKRLMATEKKLRALEKKLRKTCGAKCKKYKSVPSAASATSFSTATESARAPAPTQDHNDTASLTFEEYVQQRRL